MVAGVLLSAPDDEGQSAGTETPVAFGFSELKEKPGYWATFSIRELPRAVLIRQRGNATACLDCGNVSASLTVDVEMAMQVLDKSGTDAVKTRLDIGDEGV